MANKIDRPIIFNRPSSMIGVSARAMDAEISRSNMAYAMDHLGPMQVYSYMGPGPGADSNLIMDHPDYDYGDEYGLDQEFVIVLPSAPKRDVANPSRRLTAVLLPWRRVPSFDIDFCNRPSTVAWKHLDAGSTVYRELYRSIAFNPGDWSDLDQYTPLSNPSPIILKDAHTGTFGLFEDHNMAYPLNRGFWGSSSGATLSKDTSIYHSGSQSLKVLLNTGSNPYAEGPYLDGELDMEIGRDYTLSIFVCGDGSAYPTIVCGGVTLATGTASTGWQHLTAEFTAAGNSLRLIANTAVASQACWFDDIYLREKGRFRYQPDAAGAFTAGFLRVRRMRVAALSVFHLTDVELTDEQVIATADDVAIARAIRGYTGTGQPSLGDLEYGAGAGGTDYSIDDLERGTRRALLCSGHPLGIATLESSSYYNLRGGQASYFRIFPRNLALASSGNVSTIPVLYGDCHGAGVGNEAYVKYTAIESGDTWEIAIDSDTPAIWSDSNRLDVDAAGDTVKIEIKAPPDGWIRVRSYGLWEDAYAQ
jgi:hypothetical protein